MLILIVSFVGLMLCGLPVAVENWRRGFSPLQNPAHFEDAPH